MPLAPADERFLLPGAEVRPGPVEGEQGRRSPEAQRRVLEFRPFVTNCWGSQRPKNAYTPPKTL